jgi:hypothetical protein
MRSVFATFLVLALMLWAPAALAAPTCQDRNGDTIKCGTPGAMPVGWTPSPQQLLELSYSRPARSDTADGVKAFCLIGLILALIALLPEFDGTKAADWDRQEGDDDK